MIDKLYIDSDGVIADFEGLVHSMFEKKGIPFNKKNMWGMVDYYDKTVAPFFESLQVIDGAATLLDYATTNFDDVAILTACGYTPKNAADQKATWYGKHFPSMTVICVATSKDKAQYATSTSILVDDRSHSIDPWREAGGIGILHTSVSDTIAQLQAILDK